MNHLKTMDVTRGSRSRRPRVRMIGTLMIAATTLTMGSVVLSASGASASRPVKIDGVTISEDMSLAGHVPAAIKRSGLVDITYNDAPPDELVTNGNLVGWEVDLGKAVAATLGLSWHATASSAFDSFIPGLQNGRYNSSFTSFIVTAVRLKQIDIVTFDDIGTGFAVLKTSSFKITTPTSLCGKSVAVISGSAFIAQIKGVDPTCTKAHLPAVNVVSFPTDSAAELAVSSGRDQVYSSSADQLAWLIKQTEHRFLLQPLNYQPTAQGVGVAKKAGITNLIGEAMNHLIATGAYKTIMNHWGQTFGLVKKATVYK